MLKFKKIIFVLLLCVLAVGIFFIFGGDESQKNEISKKNIKPEDAGIISKDISIPKKEEEEIDIIEEKKEAVSIQPVKDELLPEKIFIKVPFTSQAPYANWDEKHEEACEEASLIMVKYYLDGKNLNKDIAEKEIQNLIKFQLEKYGDYRDSDATGIIQLAEDYYKINNLKAVYDFSKEDIKKELAKGRPIIIPAAGRLLGNPNFTAPGPLYHNLVLTGYEGDIVITNDPGTRKGEGYRYDIDVLFGAIHDFPGKKEDIEKGRKAMIVIGK